MIQEYEGLKDSPIFILGMPRSGTTLVQSMLDGHPELVVNFAESHFFSEFVSSSESLTSDKEIALAENVLFSHFEKRNQYHQLYLSDISYDDLKNKFRERLLNSPRKKSDYLTSSVLAYGEVSGQLSQNTRFWVEKTPNHELYLGSLFSWWKHAKCVHVVRDPRSVYNAFRRRAQKSGKRLNLSGVVYNWSRSVRQAKRGIGKYGPERYLIVRYEDIVNNPDQEIQRIIGFIDINNHESIYSSTKMGGKIPWNGNSSRLVQFEGQISKGSAEAWKDSLSANEIALIENLLCRYMVFHGYRTQTLSHRAVHFDLVPYKAYHSFMNLIRITHSMWKYRVY